MQISSDCSCIYNLYMPFLSSSNWTSGWNQTPLHPTTYPEGYLLTEVRRNPVVGFISVTSASPDGFHFSRISRHCHTDEELFTTQHKLCKCLWDGVRGSEQLAGYESCVGVSLTLVHHRSRASVTCCQELQSNEGMQAFYLFIFCNTKRGWLTCSGLQSLSRSSWKHHTVYHSPPEWKEKFRLIKIPTCPRTPAEGRVLPVQLYTVSEVANKS